MTHANSLLVGFWTNRPRHMTRHVSAHKAALARHAKRKWKRYGKHNAGSRAWLCGWLQLHVFLEILDHMLLATADGKFLRNIADNRHPMRFAPVGRQFLETGQ